MRVVRAVACGLVVLGAQTSDVYAAKAREAVAKTSSVHSGRSLAARRAAATRRLNLAAPIYRTASSQAEQTSEPALTSWSDLPSVQLSSYVPQAPDKAEGLGVAIQLAPSQPTTRQPGPRFAENTDIDGRWFLFAAVRGRAVGLNFLRDSEGSAYRDWVAERMASVGDAQLGFGWRDGPHTLSFGYVWRNMRQRDPFFNMLSRRRDEMIGVSFSVRAKPPPLHRQGQPEP